jgi:hypothetical protein
MNHQAPIPASPSHLVVDYQYGKLNATVLHDGDRARTASTSLSLAFGDCKPSISILPGEHGTALGIEFKGSLERGALAVLLRAAADELDTPVEQLGSNISLTYKIAPPKDAKQQKGEEGERKLNDWLQNAGLGYIYVKQTKELFPPVFANAVKRPDFLVLLEAVGLIAVDVKNYTLKNGGFTLRLEDELQRMLTFERLFRMPVWYAFMHEEPGHPPVWYWISAVKAIEVGTLRNNNTSGDEFIAFPLEQCERIETNEDLAKLYTQRLPSLTTYKKRTSK